MRDRQQNFIRKSGKCKFSIFNPVTPLNKELLSIEGIVYRLECTFNKSKVFQGIQAYFVAMDAFT